MKPKSMHSRARAVFPVDDRLAADDVLPRSTCLVFGHGLYRYLECTGSTNDEARELAEAGAPHGSLVVAETQTAGRGRHSRPWVSPPATGIYATLLLRPGMPPEDIPLLTLTAAVAAAEAVEKVCGQDTVIKWPNDLLLHGRKVAGILTEASITAASAFVLVGIGINVNTPAGALPPRPLFPASSLAVETGGTISRAALLAAWLERFESWYDRLQGGDRDALTSRWVALSGMAGCEVNVANMPGDVQGVVAGIAPDGALLLKTADGRLLRILTGDVQMNR